MRRISVLLLILSLMLTMLIGCSKESTDPTTESTAESTTAAPTTEEPTTEEPTTEEPSEEPTTEATEEIGLLGTLNGNTYENPLAGFGCNLDDSWYIYNDAEMAALMGLAANMYTDENIKATVEASGTAMVFYAAQNMSMPNLNITVENIGTTASLITADQYVDVLLLSLEQTLSSAGFTNITMEKTTVSFAGEDVPAVALAAEVSGVPISELLIPVVRDSYIFNTTICSSTAEECLDVLPLFYAVGYGL